MANESEPRSTGQGRNASFPIDAQLNAFRLQLDQAGAAHEVPGLLTVPGFLFRDGKDRSRRFSPSELDALRRNDTDAGRYIVDGEFGLYVVNNEGLLARHVETYRRGLEARDQLLDRIKPVEILEMVRDIWGKGEIEQTKGGGILTYPYLKAEKETVTKKITEPYHRNPDPVSGGGSGGTYHIIEKTGQWLAYGLVVRQEVDVEFGNRKFHPSSGKSLYEEELDDFFADGKFTNSLYDVRAPETIWRRPDNLGIRVTAPYVLKPSKVRDGYESAGNQWIGHYERSAYKGIRFDQYASEQDMMDYLLQEIHIQRWFDQSASQQDIMDYLLQQLETQRAVGQLPAQVEALELAKIEELRKRGLFSETAAPRYGMVLLDKSYHYGYQDEMPYG